MVALSCFFSSRRRHTRSLRDWSSDVCSSDLTPPCVREALSHRCDLPLRDDNLSGPVAAGFRNRSEERRVGKEFRHLWSNDHKTKRYKQLNFSISDPTQTRTGKRCLRVANSHS